MFEARRIGLSPRIRAVVRRNRRALLGLLLGTIAAVVSQEAGWAARNHLMWAGAVALATASPKLAELWPSADAHRPPSTAGMRRDAIVASSEARVRNRARWRRLRSMTRRLHATSRAPRQLPQPLREFRGRTAEFAAIGNEYEAQSRKRTDGAPDGDTQTGPILLLLHGMPGIGKSALAQAFAHRIAADFPDGQLFANLGIAGAARDPGEILDGFLDALGKSATERPAGDSARSKLFRSLTRDSRILILLDAARSPDQVRQLLPTGTRCAVIVTSRRDFGPALGATSLRLSPLEEPDALQVLAAYAHSRIEHEIGDAARVVELCGALPLALRSAGEQLAFEQLNLRDLVRRLESAVTRLEYLRYRGRDVEERVKSEYLRLDGLHQRAFRMLALIKSPTFLAWTLVPLLGEGSRHTAQSAASGSVGPDEAEGIAAQLAGVQLLTVVGPAGELGTARYRLHPLVRLAAEKLLDTDESADERREAADRLDAAYASLISRILARQEPEPEELIAWVLDPEWQLTGDVAARISPGSLEQWVRAEYLNLLRGIEFAHVRGSWGLCWRIAALLGSCVPEGIDQEAALRAFDLAERAADRWQPVRARIDVLVARGSFLAAVERYDEARIAIERADALTRNNAIQLGMDEALRLQATCHRKLGEAWLQLAAYRRASSELIIARGLAEQAGDDAEISRIRILMTDNDSRIKAEHWFDKEEYTSALNGDPDDATWFRAHLGLSESERRDGRWDTAIEHLRLALDRNNGDARRKAAILYRCARVRLCQSAAPHSSQNGALTYAIGYASTALLTFDAMRNIGGIIRTQCLLADALIQAGNHTEGRKLIDLAEQALISLGSHGDLYEPLTARVRRSQGNLRLAEGVEHANEACEHFKESVRLFQANGDWRSEADTQVLLGRAQRAASHGIDANIAFYSAARLYELSRDQPALEAVQELIASP